jgi:ABC-2 type transport system ATP-binding protein
MKKPTIPSEVNNIAVSVNAVSKSFEVPTESRNTIKSLFTSAFKKNQYHKLDILNNISFNVEHGDFFGIVGRNGSGKSTLLKLLAGIYTPNNGGVTVNGQLTPFIELGVGFNPELTGKENVYLNGALLGFSRKEMGKIYNKIVDFAELHDFMDQKLKNYSSGMQVRLAFSIAIQAESDILLFDEVLAVGDAAFQRKCSDIFERYRAEKKTVIIVTHDMESVRKFCTKALLISDGKIVDIGEPASIAAHYNKLNQEVTDRETEANNESQRNESAFVARISNEHGKSTESYSYGDLISVKLKWPKQMKPKNLGVAIMKESGEYMYGTNTFNKAGLKLEGNTSLNYEVKLDMGYGRYHLSYAAFGETSDDIIEFVSKGPSFIVTKKSGTQWDGLVSLKSRWYD